MAVENQGLQDQELFNAAMAPEPVQEPELQQPAPAEPVAPQVAQPEPPKAPAEPEAVIPSWRLREEADARRLAEDRARLLEERLNQLETQARQSQKTPNFYENPDEATQRMIAQSLQPMAEATQRQLMYMGKMLANTVHGAEKVDAAEKAFLQAIQSRSLDPAEYEQVVGSPNRYDSVVQWHQRHSVLSSVGTDPNAWFEKQLGERLKDPTFQAKLLEAVRGNAGGAAPSSVQLPPSLSRSTAAASNNGAAELDALSDKSLFAFATK